MLAWRITTRKFVGTAFNGVGASLYGGRWNLKGTAIVYCASSISLAAWEYFVGVQSDLQPRGLVLIPVEIPDDVVVESLLTESLPKTWVRSPPPKSLKLLGTSWVNRAENAILKVPSSVIPFEWNYLLNPSHPDFSRIRIGVPQPFRFDPRAFRSRRPGRWASAKPSKETVP